MNTSTKDRELTQKEKLIISLINSNDYLYTKTFDLVCNHYHINYLTSKSNHYLVLKAVYLEKLNFTKWALANYCHVSKTTLYEYRNDIIDCFYTCLKENIAAEKISATKG